MRKLKKWAIIALALALMTTQLAAALAEHPSETFEQAILGGAEVWYNVSFDWHDPSMAGDEANAVLGPLLDALAFSGNFALQGETSFYNNTDVLMSGVPVLPVDFLASMEDGVAISSPILGGAVGMHTSSYAGFAGAEVTPELEGFIGMIQSDPNFLLSMFDLDGLMNTLAVKVEEIMGRAQQEYVLAPSAFGAQVRSADVFYIDDIDVLDIMEEMFPVIFESTAYWEFILSLFDADTLFAESGLTRESFMEMLPYMADEMILAFQQVIPSGTMLKIYVCYDENDNHVLNRLVLSIPDDSYYSYEHLHNSLTAEWAPGGDGVRFTVDVGGEGMAYDLLLEETDTGAQAVFQATQGGADMGKGKLEIRYTDYDLDGVNEETRIMLDVRPLYPSDFGLEIVMHESYMEQTGGSTLYVKTTDLFVSQDHVPELIVTMKNEMQVAPVAVGARLNPAQTPIVYPAEMTEEELIAWTEMLSVSSAQATLRILGMLPPEVFAVLMQAGLADVSPAMYYSGW